ERLRSLGSGDHEIGCLKRSTSVVEIAAVEELVPHRTGLWSAVAAARALGGQLSGIILDPSIPLLVPFEDYDLHLPEDGRLNIAEHIVVSVSGQEGGLDTLTCRGMSKF